jgi:hypothetical protein
MISTSLYLPFPSFLKLTALPCALKVNYIFQAFVKVSGVQKHKPKNQPANVHLLTADEWRSGLLCAGYWK